MSKEVFQGIKPIRDYKAQDLITPSTTPCNTLIVLVRKPKG